MKLRTQTGLDVDTTFKEFAYNHSSETYEAYGNTTIEKNFLSDSFQVVVQRLSSLDTISILYPDNQATENGINMGDNVALFHFNNDTGAGNFSVNQTSSVFGNSDTVYYSIESIAEGNYTWNCLGYDSAGNFDFSENRTLYVESIPSVENLTLLASDDPNNYTTVDLTCDYDLNNTATTAAVSWKLNGSNYMSLYLPMEGGTLDSANDYSGNNLSVLANSTIFEYGAGYDGHGALLFNSTNSLRVNHTVQIAPSANFTVSLWAYDNSTQNTTLLHKDQSYGFTETGNFGCEEGKWSFFVYSSASTVCSSAASIHGQGNWEHLSGMVNSTHVNLFVDGTLVNSTSFSGAVDVSSQDILIGLNASYGDGFVGFIDEVRVLNVSLSAEQILGLYENNTNVIVSEETSVGDVWQCVVTPFSQLQAGIEYESNNVTIVEDVSADVFQIFYGQLAGSLTLNDSSESVQYNWSAGGVGNVYAHDVDADISFSNLQALGYDNESAASVSDFAEADFLLGLSSPNSVQGVWGASASTAAQVTNITVFGNLIENVPIANSTNSSTFVTGIFWDTSDDTNCGFDAVDLEDLVFVTLVVNDQVGFYGTYDYEMRVPEGLKSQTPSVDQVELRAEII